MTPEVKATELLNKFLKATCRSFPEAEIASANLCAIICVEEILPMASDHNITIGRNGLSDKEYWSKVLEILKAK